MVIRIDLKSVALPFLVIAGGYLLICALYYLQQERLLFIGAAPASVPSHPRIHSVEHRVDGIALRGFEVAAMDRENDITAIYFGGNAENVAHTTWPMLDVGASVYLINYRGYGKSEGKAGQAALLRDALASFDWIHDKHPASRMVVIGHSLGAAMALHLAVQRETEGLILISPFTSIRDVAAHHFPWLPVKPLLKHPFDCMANASRVRTPALVIAAQFDEVIPRRLTDGLREALAAESELHVIPNTSHNTLMGEALTWQLIRDYVRSLR